ncbi:MAG: phosphoribosylamine--glycine ligase [Thermaerobacter sp.]|nr:phosphoribosylamine--glycine ligase [Thermaerobacter sp.]
MRVLVVGGGGREHALVWKLACSERVREVHACPGNPGIAQLADCHPVSAQDLPGILNLAEELRPDLVVVGPEVPLVAGVVDRLEAAGIPAFGPSAAAARLEGSKAFARELTQRHGIPGPRHCSFQGAAQAEEFIRARAWARVVKADGLAAGKGVVVAEDAEEACRAARRLLEEHGGRVVVEERLTGREVSVLAFTDGHEVSVLEPARDHKRVFDADRGPNTGGMGAFSPVPDCPAATVARIEEEILRPTVRAMEQEGCPFRGVLYAGIMLTEQGPRVLEFNARFGDPEAQALLPRLQTDLVEVAEAVRTGGVGRLRLAWDLRAAVTVVAAAAGYPGSYAQGLPIRGLEQVAQLPDVLVFHAGTADGPAGPVTAGGRVLAVTALAPDLAAAAARAYVALAHIEFPGMHYRHDIGN